jgi:hypothetical protein
MDKQVERVRRRTSNRKRKKDAVRTARWGI